MGTIPWLKNHVQDSGLLLGQNALRMGKGVSKLGQNQHTEKYRVIDVRLCTDGGSKHSIVAKAVLQFPFIRQRVRLGCSLTISQSA